ncbi:MAG: LpxD N-terminal domain-containing protein, partial [Candidatus Hydrogenedens sp.]
MQIKAIQIAQWVDGKIIRGEEDTLITGLNSIENAREGDLIFIRDKRYETFLSQTRASAVLIAEEPTVPLPEKIVCIAVKNPEIAFIQILQKIGFSQPSIPRGLHPTAILEENVQLEEGIAIGPHVFIGKNSQIRKNTIIFPNVYIGDNCQIGENTCIFP